MCTFDYLFILNKIYQIFVILVLHQTIFVIKLIMAFASRFYIFYLTLFSNMQEIISGAGHTSAVDWWALGN